jgi:hypothetical protein
MLVMRLLPLCLAASVFFLLAAGEARANEAAPPPPPKPAAPAAGGQSGNLTLAVDDTAKEPRLQIPRKLLGKEATAGGSRAEVPPLHRVVAGVALTLALALGGLWLARSRDGLSRRRLAAVLVAVALVGAGSAFLWAEPVPEPIPPPPARSPALLLDGVRIQIIDKGDDVKLVVNRDDLARLTGALRRNGHAKAAASK